MRPSNKSRNRNKNNNRRGSAGNNINRVFESAGPEGRVRGTPQQIIDKYLSLTYDAQLSGDRVAAENFQQHAEHYSRLLLEAQKELAEKQNEQADHSSQIANNKTSAKLIGEVAFDSSSQLSQVDKREDKVVKIGANLEKKSGNGKDLPKDSPGAKKVGKKRVSEDTTSAEG